jgi:hypothetical protein
VSAHCADAMHAVSADAGSAQYSLTLEGVGDECKGSVQTLDTQAEYQELGKMQHLIDQPQVDV